MRDLKSALETGAFDRAYLFHGEDEYLKEEKMRALIERATDAATRDFNLEVRRGTELDAASLALALDALPVMAERRVVVIREIGALRKDTRAVLERYLKHAAADVVLVLVAGAETKPDAVLLDLATPVEFHALTDDELGKWIAQRASSLGVAITSGASALLVAAAGNDLAVLAGELEKLRSYTNGAEVGEAAVTAVVGVHRGETLGDLLDRAARRDGAGASLLLERVLAQSKTTAVFVVMALTTQTLAIGWAVAARARGLPAHRLDGELFSLLRENPASVVGRPWKEAVKVWAREMRHWDGPAVERALELLLTADASLKETRVSSETQLLATLLLAISADPRRRAAA